MSADRLDEVQQGIVQMVLVHRSLDDDDVLAQVAFHDTVAFSRWCPPGCVQQSRRGYHTTDTRRDQSFEHQCLVYVLRWTGLPASE
jgi:hypothetical protein